MMSDLDRSYARCGSMARSAASNFYLSFFFLPRPQRLAMCALYAFLRKTDDLSDSKETEAIRRENLRQWRDQVEAALARGSSDPILTALVDTSQRYQIPRECLFDVLDGVEMDLAPRRYETFDELQGYCHRVASAVGLACIRIWGYRDRRAFVPAKQCGVAFQLTNILRDLKEDAARGRIYLPLEDMRKFGYSEAELRRGVRNEPFRQLMQFEVRRAKQYYHDSRELYPYLEPRGRRVFSAMVATYRGLLEEIQRRDGNVFDRRVCLTRWAKIRIALRSALPGAGSYRDDIPFESVARHEADLE